MTTKLICGLALAICTSMAAAKDHDDGPSKETLQQISDRGRLLARYDQIAWTATDKMLKALPEHAGVKGYVIAFEGQRWTVAFGRLAPDRSALIAAYEESSSPDRNLETAPKPGIEITERGVLLREFLAMDTARGSTEVHELKGNYNAAILPAEKGQWFVYFYPATTDPKVRFLGADLRLLVSEDGNEILETRRLHATMRQQPVPLPAGTTTTYHTHVLSDVPEDTDVMYVMTAEPPVLDYVACPKHMYAIRPDGSIELLGETKKVLKSK